MSQSESLHSRDFELTVQKQKIADLEKENQALVEKLCRAAEIQSSMIPEDIPQMPGYDLSAVMIPAKEAGGDFYDVVQVDENKFGILLADVSDKDIHAALYMAQARGVFQTIIRTGNPKHTPEEKIRILNTILQDINRSEMFITLIYGELNTNTHEFSYIRAGNEPFRLFNKKGQQIDVPVKTGQPVGIFPDDQLLLDTGLINIETGDTFILVSDGIIDETNLINQEFGAECLFEAINQNVDNNSKNIVDDIIESVNIHRENTQPNDDCTVVVFRRFI
jgi:phosphoserine phosphatase RsbU/P